MIEALENRTYFFGGQVDLSFGHLGTAQGTVDVPVSQTPEDVALQPDGKVIVVGGDPGTVPSQIFAVRYLPDGRLDPTFAASGIFKLNRPDLDQGQAIGVLLQPSGRIVLFSSTYDHVYAIGLRPDGSLDPTFGVKGIATGAFNAKCVAMLPDGSFMLGGFTYTPGVRAASYLHLLADGKFDTAYAGRPRTLTQKGPLAAADAAFERMQPLPDGSVIAAGEVGGDILLFKIMPNGFGTRQFGTVGIETFDFGGTSDTLRGLVLLPDQSLVVLAQSGNIGELARVAPAGYLVDSFGSYGQATLKLTPTTPTDGLNYGDLALTPDGRLLVVGWSGDSYLQTGQSFAAAVNQRGRLIRSYGNGGLTTFGFGPAFRRSAGAAAAAARDGSLFVTGEALHIHNAQFGVAKLRPNGSRDAGFGTNGAIATQFTAPTYWINSSLIARQRDGKIVEMGTLYDYIVFTRFNVDGSVDRTFGDNGSFLLLIDADEAYPVPSVLTDLAIDPKGRILGLYRADESPTPKAHVVRLTPAGQLDPSFADAGILDPGFAPEDGDAAIGVQNHKLRVRRFDESGAPDRTFGADGDADLNSTDIFASNLTVTIRLVVAPDGSILVGTQVPHSPFTSDDQGPPAFGIAAGVAKFLPDGRVDQAFGNHGLAKIDLGINYGVLDTASTLSMALMPDGRIAVAGHGDGDCAVAMFRADGSLDASFGDHGVAHVQFAPYAFNDPSAILPTPDGKLLLVGIAAFFGPGRLGIIRLTANGHPDPTYGPDRTGIALTPATSFGGSGNAILQPDGKLLFAGDASRVVRFLADTDPAITAKVEAGILKVTGTHLADHMVLIPHSDGIEVASLSNHFPANSFSRIQITTLAGDDSIDASAVALPLVIDAGDGNDLVLAGRADDSITGGNGNDTLFGGQRNDTLHGDAGNDYLSGGPGQDQLFGDAGNDQLISRDNQIDSIDGGAGFDRTQSDATDLLTNTESLLR